MRNELHSLIGSGLKPQEAIVLAHPPGTGKNTIASEILKSKKTIWISDRKERLEEIAKDLEGGRDLQILRSKEEVCRRSEELQRYRAKGYYHREAEVCKHCEFKPDCEYWKEIDSNKTLLMTVKYLKTHGFEKISNEPHLVIIDELCLQALLEKEKVTSENLNGLLIFMKKHGLLTESWKKFIKALKELLEEDTTRHWHDVLEEKLEDSNRTIADVFGSEELRKLRKKAREEGPEELPHNSVLELLRTMEKEKYSYLENSHITLRQNKIEITRFHPLRELTGLPVMVLDGSANSKLYKKIFPGRKIDIRREYVTRKGKIKQMKDSPAGKCNYVRNKKELLIQFIAENRKGKTGIITTKIHEKSFKEYFPDAVVRHYGGLRGERDFEDCDTLFLVGGYFQNEISLFTVAQAVFYHEEKVSTEKLKRKRSYDRPKDNYEIEGLESYWDDRMEILEESFSLQEMYQAAYRIRPLENGKPKVVYIMTNVPIPSLPPDEFFELKPNKAKEERTNKIKNYLRNRKKKSVRVTVNELSKKYSVSRATIKKDLENIPKYLLIYHAIH